MRKLHQVYCQLSRSLFGKDEGAQQIFSIKYQIPVSIRQDQDIEYSIDSCEYSSDEGTWRSSCRKKTVDVKAAYSIDADVMVEGLSGKIRVTDEDGKPASGVEIFLSDDDNTLIGKTNANGVLSTNKFCQTAGNEYKLYAKKDSSYSYEYRITTAGPSGSDDGTPFSIAHNAAKKGTSSETVTWMANSKSAEGNAFIEYRPKESTDTERAEGTSVVQQFPQSKDSVYINRVELSGLKSGTVYEIQSR